MADSLNINFDSLPREAVVDIEEWARLTIEDWQIKITEYDLISHNQGPSLIDSFTFHVAANSNGTGMVQFAFEYYLKMLDMGVRRGHDLNDPARVPYRSKVYSKPLYHQMYRLSELLAYQYALGGSAMIINEFQHGTGEKTEFKVKATK